MKTQPFYKRLILIISVGVLLTTMGASWAVAAPVAPTLGKSFAPNPIASGDTATLTLTIDNAANATTALSAVALNDTYPPTAIINAATPNVTNSCGGSITAAPGGASVALSGGTIAAGGTQ